MTVAALCLAVLGFLVFGLGMMVSARRGRDLRTIVLVGVGDDPASPLFKASRAHIVTCEYAPLTAVMILYLGTTQPVAWVQGAMIAATVTRVLMAWAFLRVKRLDKLSYFKVVCAVLNYITGFTLCVAVALSVF